MFDHMRDLRVAGTRGSPSGFPLCFRPQCQMSKLLPIAAWASRPLLQIHVDFEFPAAGQGRLGARPSPRRQGEGSGSGHVLVQWRCTNLVDPASSHMLVSKIKPCMSQYKLLYGETANGSLKQL